MNEPNPNYLDDLETLTERLVSTYQGDSGINFIDVRNLPVRGEILHLIESLMELLFPGYTGRHKVTRDTVQSVVADLLSVLGAELAVQIELALRHQCRLESCTTCDCTDLASRHANCRTYVKY
jgi:hypothetical protein